SSERPRGSERIAEKGGVERVADRTVDRLPDRTIGGLPDRTIDRLPDRLPDRAVDRVPEKEMTDRIPDRAESGSQSDRNLQDRASRYDRGISQGRRGENKSRDLEREAATRKVSKRTGQDRAPEYNRPSERSRNRGLGGKRSYEPPNPHLW
ncbi:hypothetical protein GNI_095100, partial [Gregarina niphandrodes]